MKNYGLPDWLVWIPSVAPRVSSPPLLVCRDGVWTSGRYGCTYAAHTPCTDV